MQLSYEQQIRFQQSGQFLQDHDIATNVTRHDMICGPLIQQA